MFSSSFWRSSPCFWLFSASSCVLVWICSPRSRCSLATFSFSALNSFVARSAAARCSFSITSSRAQFSSPSATAACFARISAVRVSSVALSSSISFSIRSRLRCSRSPSARLLLIVSFSVCSCPSTSSLSASARRSRSLRSITSVRSDRIWFTCAHPQRRRQSAVSG